MTEFDKLLNMVDEDNTKSREIMIKKNHDYSGENPEDPMANFNAVEGLLGVSAEVGQMVRIQDKMSRIGNFLKAGNLKVSDESVEDTILDAINYLRLLKFRMSQRKLDKPKSNPREDAMKAVTAAQSIGILTSADDGAADISQTYPASTKFKFCGNTGLKLTLCPCNDCLKRSTGG
jgi:hypothetical protein